MASTPRACWSPIRGRGLGTGRGGDRQAFRARRTWRSVPHQGLMGPAGCSRPPLPTVPGHRVQLVAVGADHIARVRAPGSSRYGVGSERRTDPGTTAPQAKVPSVKLPVGLHVLSWAAGSECAPPTIALCCGAVTLPAPFPPPANPGGRVVYRE